MDRLKPAPPDSPAIDYDITKMLRFAIGLSGDIILQFFTQDDQIHSFMVSPHQLASLAGDVPEVLKISAERLAVMKKEITFDVP